MTGQVISAHAVAQVDEKRTGFHLLWSGPISWLYSPVGWSIQRRVADKQADLDDCEKLDAVALERLRAERELPLRFGRLLLREGPWPEGGACAIYTLELDVPRRRLRVSVLGGHAELYVFGLRDGRVVAGPERGLSTTLQAVELDTVVAYMRNEEEVAYCIAGGRNEEIDVGWDAVPFLVENLQLPFREVDPGIGDEYAVATSRLLEDERIGEQDFSRFAKGFRTGLLRDGDARPIDHVLVFEGDDGESSEEVGTLDSLAVMLVHPTWRRALGFAWFDGDPTLVPGRWYQYRVSAAFPRADLEDTIYGFHTLPSATTLPSDLRIHDLRVRLAEPATVAVRTVATADRVRVARRGVELRRWGGLHWPFGVWEDALEDFSLVLDFPSLVRSVELDLAPGHSLEFVAYSSPARPPLVVGTVPGHNRARLDFPAGVLQVRLRGDAFLHGVRVPARTSTALLRVAGVLPPVPLIDAGPPQPPVAAWAENLQRPRTVLRGAIPPERTPHRHELGFDVRWRPAARDAGAWPGDARVSPPLDAVLYEIERRSVDPPSDWIPLLPAENWTLGSRMATAPRREIQPYGDVMAAYPEVSAADGRDLSFRDVFNSEDGARPLPRPGTLHRYRVRSVDAIGRPSPTWRETDTVRLEKHVPPPLPVGPAPLPTPPRMPAPRGVHARVLVRGPQLEAELAGLPELNDAERSAIRGMASTAIVLRWGWHDDQRRQDPHAREFRVYMANALDRVQGRLTNVTAIAGGWRARLELERDVPPDAAQGLWLEAGYAFFVRGHGAGRLVDAELEVRLPDKHGALPEPVRGPIMLPLRMVPALVRPGGWAERVHVRSVGSATSYHAVLVDRLLVDEDRPRNSLWVGVSAADEEPYVTDERSHLELAPRPGNESAIVAVECFARLWERPSLVVTPRLDDVAVVVAPEPNGHPVDVEIDPAAYASALGLRRGEGVRPERASAADIHEAYRVADDGRLMALVPDRRDGEPIEVAVDLSTLAALDVEAIRRGVRGVTAIELEDRVIVYLAARHPFADRLFTAVGGDRVPLGRLRDTLPPASGRFIYRLRRANAAELLSEGSAVLPLVVRVPSLAPGSPPRREAFTATPGGATLSLRVAGDRQLTHVIAFTQVLDAGERGEDAGQLLRVAGRPDLFPDRLDRMIRLRVGGGFAAAHVKSLADPNVERDDFDGTRRVVVDFFAAPARGVRVWACTVTEDGVPSRLAGPFSVVVPEET